MHYDTCNQEGRICIGSRLNLPADTAAVFVIGQYSDSQRKPHRQGWYSWVHKTTAELMGAMFSLQIVSH